MDILNPDINSVEEAIEFGKYINDIVEITEDKETLKLACKKFLKSFAENKEYIEANFMILVVLCEESHRNVESSTEYFELAIKLAVKNSIKKNGSLSRICVYQYQNTSDIFLQFQYLEKALYYAKSDHSIQLAYKYLGMASSSVGLFEEAVNWVAKAKKIVINSNEFTTDEATTARLMIYTVEHYILEDLKEYDKMYASILNSLKICEHKNFDAEKSFQHQASVVNAEFLLAYTEITFIKKKISDKKRAFKRYKSFVEEFDKKKGKYHKSIMPFLSKAYRHIEFYYYYATNNSKASEYIDILNNTPEDSVKLIITRIKARLIGKDGISFNTLRKKLKQNYLVNNIHKESKALSIT